MRWFEVTETRGHIEDSKINHWQVTLKVGFTLDNSCVIPSAVEGSRVTWRRNGISRPLAALDDARYLFFVLRGLVEFGRAVNQNRWLEGD